MMYVLEGGVGEDWAGKNWDEGLPFFSNFSVPWGGFTSVTLLASEWLCGGLVSVGHKWSL